MSQETEPGTARAVPVLPLVGICLTLFLSALDQTVVTTALPTMVSDLGGLDQISWVVTGYLIAATVATPLSGKLGDLAGRKPVLVASLLVFVAASAACGAASNMTWLVVFRVVQGLGGGGLMASTQAGLSELVSPRDRARYQGLLGAVFGLASVTGPLVGGFLTDAVSWRSVFYINLPVGLAALLLAVRTPFAPAAAAGRRSADVAGAVMFALFATATILATLAATPAGRWGWGAAGAVLLVAFVLRERRAADPLISPALFRARAFNAVAVAAFALGVPLLGGTVFLAVYLQVLRGSTPTSAGLQMLPLMAALVAASALAGRWAARSGNLRPMPLAGTLITAAALAALGQTGATTPVWLVDVLLAVLGAGIGMVLQLLIVIAQTAAPAGSLGVASGTVVFLRSMGGAFGVALFGAIFTARLGGDTVTSLAAAAHRMGDPALAASSHEAVADAMTAVFTTGVPFALLAFAAVLAVPAITSRSRPVPEGRA
ncbi:MFS transporter [Microbispora hainanensis]|uniref:MFS transporter n=1 Tax=Microbispora hainanensis TaxID=568844 RepID=UPI0033D7DC9B